jgi:2-methylisocitrate lyase-like PEP mutase family enzyme
MSSVSSPPERFAELHAGPPFVIPNPWDVGSARVLESLGFPALATTSSGFAFTLGRPDGGATLDDVVAHVEALADAVDIPITVDLENGYGSPEVAIRGVAGAGAAGASIEDYDPARGLYELEEAIERVAAAVEAAPRPFVVTARAENHIRGNPDLDDTIRRLNAYQQVGADCLYAPGLRTVEEIRAVCEAVSKPVNVLAVRTLTVAEIFEAGAQRVSVGGALTWVAAQALVDAATAIRDSGDLSGLGAANPLR